MPPAVEEKVSHPGVYERPAQPVSQSPVEDTDDLPEPPKTAPPPTPPAPPMKPKDPKVNHPHAWAGRFIFYWREINSVTGEIGPLPGVLIEPSRPLADGSWDLNFWRKGSMQGRSQVKFSEKPKAGCFTFRPGEKPKEAK